MPLFIGMDVDAIVIYGQFGVIYEVWLEIGVGRKGLCADQVVASCHFVSIYCHAARLLLATAQHYARNA